MNQQTIRQKSNGNGNQQVNPNKMRPVYNPVYGYFNEHGEFVQMQTPQQMPKKTPGPGAVHSHSALQEYDRIVPKQNQQKPYIESSYKRSGGWLIPKDAFNPRDFSFGDWVIVAILAYGFITGLIGYFGGGAR